MKAPRLALLFGALLLGVAQPAAAVPYAAIVMRADTGEALYANNADAELHPASITKMMTLYLAFEAIESGRLRLTDQIVWSRHAADQRPTKIGLAPGRSLALDDVIRAIAVKSANDAAVALAERIDGSEGAFAAHMTREARALGMTHTHYANASGLTNPEHVTSARDIAILAMALMRRFPNDYHYFSTAEFDLGPRHYANHNHLLGRVAGVDGIKTGFTNDAGWTLAASAQRGGRRLITVVLGARSPGSRDKDVENLLDLGFDEVNHRALGQPFSIAANFRSLGASPVLRETDVAQGSGDEEDAVPVRRQHASRTRTDTHRATTHAARSHKHGVRQKDTKKAHASRHSAGRKSAKVVTHKASKHKTVRGKRH